MSESAPDLVIIGGGTGGYVAAIRAAQLGLRVTVVERDRLGGTCLHRGCIPTKALLRSAEVFHTAQEAERFGVMHSPPSFDWGRAMARKTEIVETLHRGVQHLLKKYGVTVIHGVGRVMGPSIFSPQAGAVSVESAEGPQILTPRFTLVATGSRPKHLPGLPVDGERVVTSDHALAWERLPESVIIVGAGAIGVEWASMLSDLGVQVTLVEWLPRILPLEDEDVSRELARLFERRGMHIRTGARVVGDTLEVSADGVRVCIEREDGEREVCSAECMMVAVGREPVVDDIGLEATDVQVDRGAIVVDADYRTAEPNIFAIGDVIGGLQLAHVAAHEGIHAVEVMAGLRPRPLDETLIPRCTYCRPEVASVGWTEAQARAAGRRVKVGRFPFQAVGKALVYGTTEGFVKMVADADTDDLLGVHIIGPHATDLVSEAGLARVLDATPWEVGGTIHPHPTLAEALGEAALAVDGIARHI